MGKYQRATLKTYFLNSVKCLDGWEFGLLERCIKPRIWAKRLKYEVILVIGVCNK